MPEKKAKKGDRVKIHYTGKVADGTIFDSSKKHGPLQFTLGQGQVLPGVDEAVIGMRAGEKKTVKLPAKKGFGLPRQDLIMEEDRTALPYNIKKGETLQVNSPNGKKFFATVTKLGKDKVKLDLNHLLAGKTLVFEIELLEIV